MERRSRQNAVRHGLTSETVFVALEDIEDYQAFEASVIADYDARTAVERELVKGVVSIDGQSHPLGHLRRAPRRQADQHQFHGHRAAEVDQPLQARRHNPLGSRIGPIFLQKVAKIAYTVVLPFDY